MIFSNYFFSTKNHQKNWTFCWFFEILSQYMCISKTSSKKIAFRTSRIYWKITKILKTLSDNKPRVILYLYPYLFSQYSVTLFRFCAVPIVMTIHNFITLGNCSPVNRYFKQLAFINKIFRIQWTIFCPCLQIRSRLSSKSSHSHCSIVLFCLKSTFVSSIHIFYYYYCC